MHKSLRTATPHQTRVSTEYVQMEHHAKRKRLSYACNHCRLKKTRCDEQQPSCRNCRIAGVQCITTDKRRAGAVVTHRRRSAADTPESQLNTPVSVAASPLPSNHSHRQSAQCWDRSGWRSGRLPMMPRFVGGCMFEIMTEWLDLAFYRLRIPAPYSALPGVSLASQSAPVSPPALPESPVMQSLAQNFRQTVCCIFPFLSDAHISQICDSATQETLSDQVLAYLIASVGLMTDQSHQPTITVSSYINHCNTLLGHIVAERTVRSVQTILLFSVVLRSRDQIAWAWDILALGISMAQSIGLNQVGNSGPDTERCNTWWCIYVFEKILAFESGRASTVWDRGLLQSHIRASEEDEDEKGGYKQACTSLANTLHEMQDRAAGTWRREEWLPQSVDEAIEEKVRTGGELAMLLDGWWRKLPSEFQYVSIPPYKLSISSKVSN